MRAIAKHFGIGRMTVSRAIKHHETESLSHDVQWETPCPRENPSNLDLTLARDPTSQSPKPGIRRSAMHGRFFT